ncbi:MAG: hypothetical protein U1E05_16465, partial [Patescibacteria group bacterium]|nr:hypothetical protein [Patescibacteria group bacterium]
MRYSKGLPVLAVIVGLSLACLALGWWTSGPQHFGGLIGLAYVIARVATERGFRCVANAEGEGAGLRPACPVLRPAPADANDRNALVEEMLAQNR